ncbi:MAG: S-layer homology domain-containing protein, partial [Oscillospiraceae bacterium]|nr:S-layer homology domain-containing protein [Oscillospiraceae bacterium]
TVDPEFQAVLDASAEKFAQRTFTDPETGFVLEYSLFVPEAYDGSEAYPLLMFIPDSTGAGKTAKQLVEQYYGADIWVTAEDQAKHPSFVLVPAFSETVVKDDWSVSPQIDTAMRLIAQLQTEYNIDADRIYTTGQSMGCMTSLYLNSIHPDLFAASMFVSGQWDISVLEPLEQQRFFYITAGGDAKASGGQDEVMALFDASGVPYSYGEWSAQDAAETQDAAVAALLAEGSDANMVRFTTGSVFREGQSGMEHMASFNYGYRLSAARDWLFTNTRDGAAADGEAAGVDRASVFRALYRMEGEPMVIQMLAFPDTAGKDYATVAAWAKGCGIAVGDENGNFNGDKAITRAELVTVLHRYAVYKGMDVSVGESTNILSYDDALDLPAWCVPAFQWACGADVIAQQGSRLAPGETVSESELAGCMERFAALSGEPDAVQAVYPAPVDMSRWQYNAEDDVYYQLGIEYCAAPADTKYENLAIFVPGAYFTGADNGDGTFTCAVDPEGSVNGYSAATAPVVLPVNTPGYSAMSPLSAYTSLTDYTGAGFVYVHAGCRGRDAGAPAGVTDLKAALRYVRWNAENLPGDMDSVFSFGMSGGGAQSALLGATGDSALYVPYLNAIGAVMDAGISDAVSGSMCWCPITSLPSGSSAYEWMMGSTRSGLSDEEQAISDALAEAYGKYINDAGIPGPDGTVLTLEASPEGFYQAGSYYDFIVSEIERSLNNFLADTAFPYDASASSSSGGPGGGFTPPEGMDFGGMGGPGGERGRSFEDMDDISRTQAASGLDLSGVYETPQDYIDAMNAEGVWVSYDAESNTAHITGIADFVKAFKPVSKGLGAFDQLDAGQGENVLFGYGDGNGAHFDP